MSRNTARPIASASAEESEVTERATLQIRSVPFEIMVSGQGTTTTSLVVGVIGPVATIGVGSAVGLPTWMIMMICVLQIIAGFMSRRRN